MSSSRAIRRFLGPACCDRNSATPLTAFYLASQSAIINARVRNSANYSILRDTARALISFRCIVEANSKLPMRRNEQVMVRVLYFSPTGGTKRAAEGLARAFCEGTHVEWLDISSWDYDADALSFGEEDLCIVALPCFGGRAPQFAVPRMRALKANGASAILLTAYGNREFEDILLEMQEAMERAGFYIRGAIAAVAQHSFCPEIATGRPSDEDLAELADYGRILREADERSDTPLVLPGNRPFSSFDGLPFHPHTLDKCIECGVCVKACPMHAIPETDPKQTDDLNCISCMQCVSICPEHARDLDRGTYDQIRELLREKGAFDGDKPNALFTR